MTNNIKYYCLKISQSRIGIKYLKIKKEHFFELKSDKFFELFNCKKIISWNNTNHVIYQEDGIRTDILHGSVSFYVSDKFKNIVEKFSSSKLV